MRMRGPVKSLIKRGFARAGLTVSRVRDEPAIYHDGNRRDVEKILAVIEAQKGKSDPRWISRSTEYAADVLGWAGYAPWLWVYSAVSGSFKEGSIPDNYYGAAVLERVKGSHGRVCGLKTMARHLFGDSALFPDVAYKLNSAYFAPGRRIGAAELKTTLFRDGSQVIYKGDHVDRGDGVRFFSRDSFDPGLLQELPNEVFQTRIVQHPTLAQFAPSSVATLRLTTAVTDLSDYQLRAAYLRLGTGTDTHVQSRSHVRVAVDTETGALADDGFASNWRTIERHPDSHVAFKGISVPEYRKCVQSVLELHRYMPTVQCIGWDVAVDADNRVQVMEWNGYHNDIKFSEATQGPCFTDLGWENLWRDGQRHRLEPHLPAFVKGDYPWPTRPTRLAPPLVR